MMIVCGNFNAQISIIAYFCALIVRLSNYYTAGDTGRFYIKLSGTII